MDRELSSKELVEQSNIENKELILERMKAESFREKGFIKKIKR